MTQTTDRDLIRDVISSYCQRCDDGDFEGLADLFTEGATLRVLGSELVGRTAVRDWFVSAQPPEARGKHFTTNAIVAVDGVRATGTADFLFVRFDDQRLVVSAVGRYTDEYERVDDRWRISRREIEILRPHSV